MMTATIIVMLMMMMMVTTTTRCQRDGPGKRSRAKCVCVFVLKNERLPSILWGPLSEASGPLLGRQCSGLTFATRSPSCGGAILFTLRLRQRVWRSSSIHSSIRSFIHTVRRWSVRILRAHARYRRSCGPKCVSPRNKMKQNG